MRLTLTLLRQSADEGADSLTLRFADVHYSGTAFAVNLLGAIVGGALEYLSLVTGYRVLLIVIGGRYGLAFVTGLSSRSASRPGSA